MIIKRGIETQYHDEAASTKQLLKEMNVTLAHRNTTVTISDSIIITRTIDSDDYSIELPIGSSIGQLGRLVNLPDSDFMRISNS